MLTLPLSALVAWAINSGGEALRWVGLGAVAWSLAIPMLVSLEAGLFAMMLFEPLRGFLRRAQYLFLPYSQSDPIHVITPLITCMAFVLLLQRRRLGMFTQTKQAKLVSILCLIYFLQIFNPLQGGLSIGLTGALFILVPVAWFYFGQEIKPEFIHTLLRAIVIIGLITSVYGLYHLVYGFPSFEQYWLDHTDAYESISLGRIKRALATFSSAEEWGRYLEVGAIIAFGLVGGAAGYLKKAGWFLSGAALTAMLMLTGQRTALFGLVLGIVVLLVAGAKTWQGVLVRLMLTLAPVILVVVLVNAPTTDDMISLSEEERFGIVLSHTTRGALNPTQEGSLQERITIWTYLATEIIPNNPLGMGLGATSLLAARHEGSDALPPTDSYVIGSVITCGLPTALLFIWILLRSSWVSWRSVGRETNGTVDGNVWRILAALMPALILNSFFGNTFTLYSVAPIGWLLVGWISAQELSRSKTREPFYL
ncbi:MAG TPA: O-antigen ligase family protein [Pyrinomonadaceae bacterium]|nr:O-antigen ligase family protein [Pyrinomonadaceae bacterium]